MTEDRLNELPKGWAGSKLGDIALIQGGFAFKSKDYKRNGIPLVRISNIKDHRVTFEEDTVFLENDFVQEYSDFLIGKGDILIALSGATTGKFGVYEKDETALLNQRVGQIKFYNKSLISSRFIFHYMRIIRGKILSQAYGMAQPNISTKELGEFAIPLPPLPEQHRIVAKSEELFTKLAAGIEALKKVKAQLKRYRQAVLKYAFEGKLTQEWREANKGKIEPASVLLKKIKEERKKETKGKFKELPPVDTPACAGRSELPELPDGWEWTRVGEISKMIQYGTSEKANADSAGIPVIRMGNILDGKIILGDLKYFPKQWPQLENFTLQGGDVLFNRTNSMELVGKTAVYKDYYPKAVFASYLIRVRLNRDFYRPELLSFFINSFYAANI